MRQDLVWPAVVVALVLVVGFVALAATNHDTSAFVVFVSGPLVSTLVGAVLVKRVAAVQTISETVETQTNSLLSNRLTHIDGALLDAKTERETIARQGPVGTLPQQPADLAP